MATNHAKRAFEILQEEGPIALFKAFVRFIWRQLDPWYPQHHFKFQTLKNDLQNRVRYDAPPHSYRTIKIRPSDINTRLGRDLTFDEKSIMSVKAGGLSRTKTGEWDKEPYRRNIEEIQRVRAIRQRFAQGKQWEHTYLSCNKERYTGLEELFNKIQKNGYKTGHTGDNHRPNTSQPVRDRLEVLVAIDRNGEIGLYEGVHRFAIARVLDIEIPAQVVCRHKQWQELRDEIHNNGLPEGREDLRDHPDLQDILGL